ncbi:hypothetical protein S40288_09507 [Stachybotrys chartarum IBT 40288]|nr:hypothetical protein S40288_09507 [Stachybotrys chartarum IBT 40288]
MRFSTIFSAALYFASTVVADFSACDNLPGIQIFPAGVRPETVSNQTRTCSHSFDAPKVLPVGDTSYDWWYFDAVADDGVQSLVVVFMQKGENSDFPGPALTAYVQITRTLSNGTAFTETLPVDQGIVSTSGLGTNGYIALDGEIIRSGPDFMTVRPEGANSEHPPTGETGVPEGFHITADLGDAGVLEASVRYTVVAASFRSYGRWAGMINGTIASTTTNSTVASKAYLGVTHYEMFNFF